MRRLSSDLERRIIELWFKGFSRDEIARTVGVAVGTVSNVIGTFPDCLNELRDLSVLLHKINALPSEALKGADLLAKLNQLGVKLTQVETFIETLEKQSEVAGYQPAQVIQAALALHNLEKQASGKSYVDALKEFEDKTKKTQKLSMKAKELPRRISALNEEHEQALQRAKTTDKEIQNLKTTENGLRQHGLSLGDPQSLLTYLERVKEMGGSPRLFIEFSKKYGSFEEALERIKDSIKQENSRFTTLKRENEVFETRITQREIDLAQLEKQETNRLERIETLKREESETSGKINEKRAELAESLKVSNNSEEIARAINDNELKLAELTALNLKSEQDKSTNEATLRNIQNQITQLIQTKEELEREINERLKIKNFVTEHQQGIDRLKQEKISLDEEVAQRRDEAALQQTLKNFYVDQSQYDFGRFYNWVELLKYIREHKPETSPIITAQIENGIREQALQVFKGYLVPKSEFEALNNEKDNVGAEYDQLKSEVQELRDSLKTRDGELTILKNENQLLAKIKLTVESGQTTLKALRDWMILQCNEEIDRRADEKYNSIGAAAYGTIGWISEQVASRIRRRSTSDQQ